MIGGHDIIFNNVSDPEAALRTAMATILFHWPQAVIQDGRTGALYWTLAAIPFSREVVAEVLIYRDTTSFEKWDSLGATPETEGSMIHLLQSSNRLTIVVGDSEEKFVKSLVDEVGSILGRVPEPPCNYCGAIGPCGCWAAAAGVV
jgi:hypothetical protein